MFTMCVTNAGLLHACFSIFVYFISLSSIYSKS